jgi:hypothetical protein
MCRIKGQYIAPRPALRKQTEQVSIL